MNRDEFIPFDEFHDMASEAVRLTLKDEIDKKEYVMDNFIALYLPNGRNKDGLYLISRNKVGFRAGIRHGIDSGFLNQKVLSVSFHSGDVSIKKIGGEVL